MKKYLFILLVLVFTVTLFAGSGEKYGKEITLTEKTTISEIMANPTDFVGKKVLVEGMVVGVCKKRGCWMDLASDKEFEKVRIKVEDGVIVFPLEAKGKTALVEGEVYSLEIKKEEECSNEEGHEGETKAKTKTETIYMIRGIGAVIN